MPAGARLYWNKINFDIYLQLLLAVVLIYIFCFCFALGFLFAIRYSPNEAVCAQRIVNFCFNVPKTMTRI